MLSTWGVTYTHCLTALIHKYSQDTMHGCHVFTSTKSAPSATGVPPRCLVGLQEVQSQLEQQVQRAEVRIWPGEMIQFTYPFCSIHVKMVYLNLHLVDLYGK